MYAAILSVGDELVLGQTVDTNSAWLSARLAAVGCDVVAHATAPDDQKQIEGAIRHYAPQCDVLLISGGIGPTEDDLTRQALAAVLGEPLELSAAWLERLEAFFRHVGRPMPESNRIQAMIPRGTRMVENTNGTAAGLDATYEPTGAARPCRIFVMPGVPKEMKAMFERSVLPVVQQMGGGGVILSRTLHTFGQGESSVAERLGELMQRGRNPSVGTTVAQGIVSLRVNARFQSRAEAERKLEETVSACRAALGDLIFGQDEQALPHVVAELLAARPGVTVATAESCTGGLLAKMLTDVAGSSAYFAQGWVTYTNESKSRQLNVPPELIERHGAVSEPVAGAMAAGAKAISGATYAWGITGVAGPAGGTEAKPVGTVCIALATPEGVVACTHRFPGDREMVRDRSAKTALSLLRYELLKR